MLPISETLLSLLGGDLFLVRDEGLHRVEPEGNPGKGQSQAGFDCEMCTVHKTPEAGLKKPTKAFKLNVAGVQKGP